jgi:hypothetical protein
VSPAYSSPDTTLRMAWVLSFPRARRVYDDLIRDRIWSNPAGQGAIGSMLRRKGLLTQREQVFGRLTDPAPQQDPDYINQRSAGGYSSFDDLTGTLGAFNFRVVVAGTVKPQGGTGRLPVPGNHALAAASRSELPKWVCTSAIPSISRAISTWVAGAMLHTDSCRSCLRPRHMVLRSHHRSVRLSATATPGHGATAMGAVEIFSYSRICNALCCRNQTNSASGDPVAWRLSSQCVRADDRLPSLHFSSRSPRD